MSKTYRYNQEEHEIGIISTSIKPKRKIYCYDCHKNKLLFQSKEKAERFMLYNSDAIKEENGFAPVRAYRCQACGGWHVTHLEAFNAQSRYEKFYETLSKKKKLNIN